MTESPEVGLIENTWSQKMPIRERLRGILEAESERVDHIIVTGDLTDSGLDVEYEQVVGLFESVGCRGRMTVIPGNHELVQGGVFSAADKAEQLRRFRSWCGPYLPAASSERRLFPYVQWLHDRIVFIGLDTTGEGRSLYASSSGNIDQEQLDSLRTLLSGMPEAVRKVVGIHHSLYPPKTRKNFLDAIRERFFMYLENAETLRSLLLEFKNVVVLHGHHHFELFHEDQSGEGRLINLGAASSTIPDEEEGSLQYVIVELYDDAVMSLKQTYEDDPEGGIRLVGRPIRRRFSLQDAALPSRIARLLRTPRFLRGVSERLALRRWRQAGALDGSTRASLKLPGFLRSASDKLSLRRRDLLDP